MRPRLGPTLELEENLQQANVEQARAVAANTEAKLDLAEREHRRLSRLVTQGAVAAHLRPTSRQVAVIFAILLSGAMTGYYTRLVQTALPDLQGIWGLSYDQGAILKTCAVAPQMLIAPVISWLITVFGFRPVLLPAALAFVFVSFITPFLTGYIPLLAAHALMGALLGCVITATIMIMTRTIPGKWWIIPLGFYVFRMSLTINTGVSVGALYIEYFGWQWIY